MLPQQQIEARATVVETATGVVIRLEGEIDLYARDELQRAFAETHGLSGAAAVVVDLTGVDFIDSSAVGQLVQFRRRLAFRGAALTILCPSRDLFRVFEISGLDRIFTITREAAAAA